ncbi:MAG: hypothetical protein IJ086_08505 [Clostridium sp.]|nr:hypothetical protein [Clostridium sp.]
MKTKILNKMNKELNDLKGKINLIENLEVAPVDEETWHKICLTPARYEDDLLLAIAKATFPQGKNFIRYSNEVIFTLNGFTIKLYTCAYTGIEIDLNWFKSNYKEEPKEYRRFDKMRRYFELLDSGNYTWYELASSRCTLYPHQYTKTRLFIWWFTQGKWHKVDRSKWEERFRIEDEQIEKKKEKHKNKVLEIESKLEKINDTIDILKQFAEVRGRINGTLMNIENYFK